ncbi:MAG TPA: hypothetical protein VL098_08300 [Flavipsychrobacter sp.]|nr:hypothetical protein [Flavipsychrobacter sp.]
MGLSAGEVGLGLTQISIGLSGRSDASVENASSLPGLVTYKQGSPFAPQIDALGGFMPGTLTGGNIAGMLDGVQSIIRQKRYQT